MAVACAKVMVSGCPRDAILGTAGSKDAEPVLLQKSG